MMLDKVAKPVSELMQIQPTIIHYTKLLSGIMQLDVEVVDASLVRIAGTGRYEHCIGDFVPSGTHVLCHVLQSKQQKLLLEPTRDPVCQGCQKIEQCNEKAFLGVPIIIHDRCIGVLSMVAFTDKARDHLLENQTLFSDYISHTSQMFVSKVLERSAQSQVVPVESSELQELLHTMMDWVDQGILVLSERGQVRYCNQHLLHHLKSNWSALSRCRVSVLPTNYASHQGEGLQHYYVNFDDQTILVSGQLHRLRSFQILVMSMHQPQQNERLNASVPELSTVIGECYQLQRLKRIVLRISSSPSTVLVRGESGTGKEVFAKAIHELSERRNRPFVAINCAAIPDQLLESELFGYERGAFTGASTKGKKGLILSADGGTLFLDEIGDMSLQLQAKLLRVLEAREVMPVGASKAIPIDVRIITATHRDFEEMIREKSFREDLYYRLNVIPLYLPPLRERRGDVALLVRHFLDLHVRKIGGHYPEITPAVIDRLDAYEWPGNIRELSNLIEYLVNLVHPGEAIDVELLPPHFNRVRMPQTMDSSSALNATMNLEEMEKTVIEEALARHGNRKLAAEELGIGIATLYRKIKKYDLT